MVRLVDTPYASPAVRPKLSSIKWKLACGIGMARVYFITLADNKNDLFDIYPAAVFKQRTMRKSDRIIIGVAESHDSAKDIIESMICECLDKCGDLSDIRGYFERFVKEHL